MKQEDNIITLNINLCIKYYSLFALHCRPLLIKITIIICINMNALTDTCIIHVSVYALTCIIVYVNIHGNIIEICLTFNLVFN